MIRDSEEVLRGVEEAWHTARCRGEGTSVTLLRALRPDVGGWVTLSPRYWTDEPSDNDGGRAPYSAVRVMT